MPENTRPTLILVDEVYSWLESNPGQMGMALTMVAAGDSFVSDVHAELKDWLTQLLTRGGHWAFPPLRYAELTSLSSLRRRCTIPEEPLMDADVASLYSRLLKLVEPPRC